MYVLNITFSVDKTIFQDWLDWYSVDGEVQLSSDPLVEKVKLFNILGAETEEEETRCVHLEFKNNKDLHQFYVNGHKQFTDQITNKYGEKCLYFASVLELIKEK